MFNCISLEGRLVSDPKLSKTRTGLSICNLTIACDRPSKKDGKQPLFIPCRFFGVKAENVAKYTCKGKAIIVTGRLECDLIDDNVHQGEKKPIYYIDAQQFDFTCGNRGKPSEAEGEPKISDGDASSPIGSDNIIIADDEMPF